jgi:hypothetical protein
MSICSNYIKAKQLRRCSDVNMCFFIRVGKYDPVVFSLSENEDPKMRLRSVIFAMRGSRRAIIASASAAIGIESKETGDCTLILSSLACILWRARHSLSRQHSALIGS